jgi:hypothetical protein
VSRISEVTRGAEDLEEDDEDDDDDEEEAAEDNGKADESVEV